MSAVRTFEFELAAAMLGNIARVLGVAWRPVLGHGAGCEAPVKTDFTLRIVAKAMLVFGSILSVRRGDTTLRNFSDCLESHSARNLETPGCALQNPRNSLNNSTLHPLRVGRTGEMIRRRFPFPTLSLRKRFCDEDGDHNLDGDVIGDRRFQKLIAVQ
eukprot:1754619-Rhodomonas_salina.5